MGRILLLIFLLVFLLSGSGLCSEWPEGWSRIEHLGKSSRNAPDYDLAFSKEGHIILAAGRGGFGSMQIAVQYQGKEVFLSSEQFAVYSPQLEVDEDGNWHLFYTKRTREDYEIVYNKFSSAGEIIIRDQVLYSIDRRIFNPDVTIKGQNLYLVWTVYMRPHYALKYQKIATAGQVLEEAELRKADGSIESTLEVDWEGNLNLFWRVIEGWDLNLYYQTFLSSGEPKTERQHVTRLTPLDDKRKPLTDSRVLSSPGRDDEIIVVFNMLDREEFRGRDLSYFAMMKVEGGEILEGPKKVSPSMLNIREAYIAVHDQDIHLGFVQFRGGRFQPLYLPLDYEGRMVGESQVLDVSLADSFRSRILTDQDGYVYYTWQRYDAQEEAYDIWSRNNRYPEKPPLSFRLGFGEESLLTGYFYVFGLSLIYGVLRTLVRLPIMFLVFLGTFYLPRRFSCRLLEKYPLHGGLVVFSVIFLLQDSFLDFFPVTLPCSSMSITAAVLATLFTFMFMKLAWKWLTFSSIEGFFSIIFIWIYWSTFFTLIPHLIAG